MKNHSVCFHSNQYNTDVWSFSPSDIFCSPLNLFLLISFVSLPSPNKKSFAKFPIVDDPFSLIILRQDNNTNVNWCINALSGQRVSHCAASGHSWPQTLQIRPVVSRQRDKEQEKPHEELT